MVLMAGEGNASVLFTADLAKAVATCTSTQALLPYITSQEDVALDDCSCCKCLHRTRLDSASSIWQTLLWLFLSTNDQNAYARGLALHHRLLSCPCRICLRGGNAPQLCPLAGDHWKPHAQSVPLPMVFLGQRKRLCLTS